MFLSCLWEERSRGVSAEERVVKGARPQAGSSGEAEGVVGPPVRPGGSGRHRGESGARGCSQAFWGAEWGEQRPSRAARRPQGSRAIAPQILTRQGGPVPSISEAGRGAAVGDGRGEAGANVISPGGGTGRVG